MTVVNGGLKAFYNSPGFLREVSEQERRRDLILRETLVKSVLPSGMSSSSP